MSDKLPENANEAVAKACEFTERTLDGEPLYIDETTVPHHGFTFRPATDDAAALKALFAWCRKNESAWQLNGIPSSGGHVQCQVWNHQGVNHCATEASLAEAVCVMILAAEEART